MTATIEKTKIKYNGKEVEAHKVTITSEIPMDIDSAWEKLQTSALLEFVSTGKVTFIPEGGHFPEKWQEGCTVTTKMLLYGFLPFGGLHSIHFEKIDNKNKVIKTREADKGINVWNHTMTMQKLFDNTTQYKDEILIYGGWMTAIISWWAKSYYQYRHQRWQLVADIG